MRFARFSCLTLVAGLLTASSAAAADGVLIVQRITNGTSVTTTQAQIEKARMRTEITDPTGAKQIVLFDGAKQVMTIINVTSKSYSEMTKADLDRMATQLQGMMAQMKAQLASLPPAQRAQMEAMMSGRGMPGSAPAEKTTYTRSGTDKAGKWACTKYDGTRGGQKVSELCTVEPSVLGFTAADFTVAQQMAEFFQALMPGASDQVVTLGRADVNGFSGLPIKSSMTTGGRTTTTEVTDASRQNFADALFAVPAGYQKQAIAMGGRGR